MTLMDRLFRLGEFTGALTIAEYFIHVHSNTKFTSALAECHSIKGRISQMNEEYNVALSHFEIASKLVSNQTSVLFGLGQMYTYQADFDKAIESYQALLVNDSQNYETLKRLASIYSNRPGMKQQAIECFDRLLVLLKSCNDLDKKSENISDPEIFIEYAQLIEDTDVKSSLNCSFNF